MIQNNQTIKNLIKMKKIFLLFSLLLIGSLILIVTNCEKDPEESCQQDTFCDAQIEVTVCCTSLECVYKYNGKEYPDNEEGENQLAEDLGCSSAKSTTYERDMAAIIKQLQELMDKTRELYINSH